MPTAWCLQAKAWCCCTKQDTSPNRISAIDTAVRCFAKKPAKNVITPVLGITFDSLGEASGDALTDLLLVNQIQWSTIFI